MLSLNGYKVNSAWVKMVRETSNYAGWYMNEIKRVNNKMQL